MWQETDILSNSLLFLQKNIPRLKDFAIEYKSWEYVKIYIYTCFFLKQREMKEMYKFSVLWCLRLITIDQLSKHI